MLFILHNIGNFEKSSLFLYMPSIMIWCFFWIPYLGSFFVLFNSSIGEYHLLNYLVCDMCSTQRMMITHHDEYYGDVCVYSSWRTMKLSYMRRGNAFELFQYEHAMGIHDRLHARKGDPRCALWIHFHWNLCICVILAYDIRLLPFVEQDWGNVLAWLEAICSIPLRIIISFWVAMIG